MTSVSTAPHAETSAEARIRAEADTGRELDPVLEPILKQILKDACRIDRKSMTDDAVATLVSGLNIDALSQFGRSRLMGALTYQGHLSVLKSLSAQWTQADTIEYGGIGCCGPLFHAVLESASRGGYITIAQWLVARFSFDQEFVIDAFRQACIYDQLRHAEWLADHYGLTTEDVRKGRILYHTCAHMDAPTVAEWLVTRFGLTAEDISGLPQCWYQNHMDRGGKKKWIEAFIAGKPRVVK